MANSFSSFVNPNSAGRRALGETNHASRFTAKFHRCLGHVQDANAKRGTDYNEYGVCTASIGYSGSYTADHRRGARTPKGRAKRMKESNDCHDPDDGRFCSEEGTTLQSADGKRKAAWDERGWWLATRKRSWEGTEYTKDRTRAEAWVGPGHKTILPPVVGRRRRSRLAEVDLHESKTRERMTERFGITEFAPGNIGYSPSKKRWYGWSHRAVAGFTIGDTVKKGDAIAPDPEYHTDPEGVLPLGFTAKTMDDAKRMARAFARAVS